MNANELRLGNLIYAKLSSGKGRTAVHTVAAYNIVNIADGVTSSFIFEPIPLTEEWLLQFGFEHTRYGFIKGGLHLDNDFSLFIEDETGFNTWSVELKYVHQLQNLYFAIIGQELTLIK